MLTDRTVAIKLLHQPIAPYHPVRDCWVLEINGQPADHDTSLPTYNPHHSYTFTINAPGGILTFDACDGMRSDTTGSVYITIMRG